MNLIINLQPEKKSHAFIHGAKAKSDLNISIH